MKCAMLVLGSLAMASAFVPAAPKMSRSKYTQRKGMRPPGCWEGGVGRVERGRRKGRGREEDRSLAQACPSVWAELRSLAWMRSTVSVYMCVRSRRLHGGWLDGWPRWCANSRPPISHVVDDSLRFVFVSSSSHVCSLNLPSLHSNSSWRGPHGRQRDPWR